MALFRSIHPGAALALGSVRLAGWLRRSKAQRVACAHVPGQRRTDRHDRRGSAHERTLPLPPPPPPAEFPELRVPAWASSALRGLRRFDLHASDARLTLAVPLDQLKRCERMSLEVRWAAAAGVAGRWRLVAHRPAAGTA